MEQTRIVADLQGHLETIFIERQASLFGSDSAYVAELRQLAFGHFKHLGFPTARMEKWRGTDLSKALLADYEWAMESPGNNIDLEKIFQCEVPHFETFLVAQLNGWYVYKNSPLTTLPNGMIVGSLAKAFLKYPELINQHYGKYANVETDGLTALNTAFAQDGIFIFVPDGVAVPDVVQMVNIVDSAQNLMLQTRNLVILGKNSHLKLVQCDDSINHKISFINSVSEFYIDRDSTLDHYKLQNKDENSTLINTLFVQQEQGSTFSSNAISLNGGIIRNSTNVKLSGENCAANIYGVYLMDRNQHIDNQVLIDHAVPRCQSNELFKGILDDHASGVFNGHVIVRKDAQQTNAYQTNKNILLTDKATIDTKPFLEIYADDVKCSHGATVGQLDADAMFYIRSRGISENNARILLMYAFAAEVVNKIDIPELRQRIDDMVKKRLRGELSYCDQCVLHCNSQEKSLTFDIDMTKV
ncbi:MAG: Fe-S cluster assembly protein SufD [Bacteroidales bacterium]|nr:Fe-S cluster assembly protein SufD [Bacteroidales bacterium]